MTHWLDEPWYATPNIHLCTVRDFIGLCDQMELTIEKSLAVRGRTHARAFQGSSPIANFFAEEAVFLLSRNEARG